METETTRRCRVASIGCAPRRNRPAPERPSHSMRRWGILQSRWDRRSDRSAFPVPVAESESGKSFHGLLSAWNHPETRLSQIVESMRSCHVFLCRHLPQFFSCFPFRIRGEAKLAVSIIHFHMSSDPNDIVFHVVCSSLFFRFSASSAPASVLIFQLQQYCHQSITGIRHAHHHKNQIQMFHRTAPFQTSGSFCDFHFMRCSVL